MLANNDLLDRWKQIGEIIKGLNEEKRQIRKQMKESSPSINIPGPGRPRNTIDKNKERNEQVASLFKEGKTLKEIGDMYGFSREYIRQILKKSDITGKDGGSHIKTIKTRCSIDGCSVKDHMDGLCKPHYEKLIKYGDMLTDHRRKNRACSVDGCNLKHVSNGYCNTHLTRWRTKGDAGSAEILPVGKHKNRGTQSKLNDAQKEQIRKTYKREPAVAGQPNEFSLTGLAKKYNVSPTCISSVIKNTNRKD